MSARDGGPAFPWEVRAIDSIGVERTQASGSGMTLRDYFAGQALAGALANSRDFSECSNRDIAEFAYGQADAMLAARDKGGAS